MRIINPDALFARVSVPERFQAMVRVDDPASIRVPGRREPVLGLVDLVNEKIDPQTRSFEIRIAVDNRKRLFKAGSFVNVALPVRSVSDVLVVPQSAIVMQEGRPSVFVVQGDRVERRWPTLGIRGESVWEVVEGIEHGDRVVVSRGSMLDDGTRVKVVE
jgi:membrane fusion protein (multidrug efflux system)